MSVNMIGWVWANSPYEGTALLIHLAIADFANDDGLCFPKQVTIAAKARCSERYVRDATKRMIADGYLVIEKSSNGRLSHLYRLVTPATRGPAELSSGGSMVPPSPEVRFRSHRKHGSGHTGTLLPEITVMEPSSNRQRTITVCPVCRQEPGLHEWCRERQQA